MERSSSVAPLNLSTTAVQVIDLTLDDEEEEVSYVRTPSRHQRVILRNPPETEIAHSSGSRIGTVINGVVAAESCVIKHDPMDNADEEVLEFDSDNEHQNNPNGLQTGSPFSKRAKKQSPRGHEHEARERREQTPPPPLLENELLVQVPIPLSSPQDMPSLDDVMGQLPSPILNPVPPPRRRRQRTRFTEEQLSQLHASFYNAEDNKLTVVEVVELSERSGLTVQQIRSWCTIQRRKIQAQNNAFIPATPPPPIPETPRNKRPTPSPDPGDPDKRVRENVVNHHHSSASDDSSRAGPSRDFWRSSGVGTYRIPRVGGAEVQSSKPKPDGIPSTQPANANSTRDASIIEEAKLEERMKAILSVPDSALVQELKICEDRVRTLYKLYVSEAHGFKKTVVSESRRLVERSSSSSPFNDAQKALMDEWRKKILHEKIQRAPENVSTDQLKAADNIIVAIWLPVLLYSGLLDISTQRGIMDFTYWSKNRAFSADSDNYLTTGYLHYIEKAKH